MNLAWALTIPLKPRAQHLSMRLIERLFARRVEWLVK